MLRYQGVDWRDKANWACNKRCGAVRGRRWAPGAARLVQGTERRHTFLPASPAARILACPPPQRSPASACARPPPRSPPTCSANPYGEHYLDGVSLNPFEVLFVKARGGRGRVEVEARRGGGGQGSNPGVVPLSGHIWRPGRPAGRRRGAHTALAPAAPRPRPLPRARRSRSVCCRTAGPLRCRRASTGPGWRRRRRARPRWRPTRIETTPPPSATPASPTCWCAPRPRGSACPAVHRAGRCACTALLSVRCPTPPAPTPLCPPRLRPPRPSSRPSPTAPHRQARGPDCFDAAYYAAQNPDLKQYTRKDQLWAHFLRGGAYEGRAFRFTCPWQPPQLPRPA